MDIEEIRYFVIWKQRFRGLKDKFYFQQTKKAGTSEEQ